jgi:hypothetical protein
MLFRITNYNFLFSSLRRKKRQFFQSYAKGAERTNVNCASGHCAVDGNGNVDNNVKNVVSNEVVRTETPTQGQACTCRNGKQFYQVMLMLDKLIMFIGLIVFNFTDEQILENFGPKFELHFFKSLPNQAYLYCLYPKFLYPFYTVLIRRNIL